MKLPSKYPNIGWNFDDDWWMQLLNYWNEQDQSLRTLLAGAGTIVFEIEGHAAYFVHWDVSGYGHLRLTGESTVRFVAAREIWKQFVERRFGAAAGVIEGTLSFYGPVSRILSHVKGFDALADLASNIV